MDNFNTLTQRLQNRCPAVGIVLAGQLINDAWHQFQARREWSFRRRSGTMSPPPVYSAGMVSTNAGSGNPNVITGMGTAWTASMVGSQIRIGGSLYPYYTISQYISPTELLIDQPWTAPDLTSSYEILQVYYQLPADFNYFHVVISTQNAQRLWTTVTQNELGVLDPQRTSQGNSFATAFRDFTRVYSGTISPVIPVTSPTDPAPVSTTTFGFTYPANASYIVQVVTGGAVGTATFQWLRAGQQNFQSLQLISNSPQDLSDGVQVYWPNATYIAGDLFVINCECRATQSVPRYELWPAPVPTLPGAVYPYVYIAKEYDISAENPTLPPFVANRGDVLLEMALAACARYPGADQAHANVYFNLNLAEVHEARAEKLITVMEASDEEVSVTSGNYSTYPMAPAPWTTRPKPAVIPGSTGGDNFNTLANRLLDRCPMAGIQLAEQLINDAWHQFQGRREWSFRRRSGTFSSPVMYSAGAASTNASTGSPALIVGTGTVFTPQMVGSQIRIGGPLYPYYTVMQYLSPAALIIDQPWAGPDLTNQQYEILQAYYRVPSDFNYFHVIISTRNNQRLWTSVTQNELGVLDPQRTNQGQAFATAFRDFAPAFGGIVGPVIPVTNPTDPAPVSISTSGFTYPSNASYIIQVVTGGLVGTATFQWMRAGQSVFQGPVTTSLSPQDLSDGVQIYWPQRPGGPTWGGTTTPWGQDADPWNAGYSYIAGDIFFINCESQAMQGAPRYELWPTPTPPANGDLYPYIYIAKEYDLTAQNPILPPFVANRGDVLLEMALASCARFPGADAAKPNVYFNLELASLHEVRAEKFIAELTAADEEVSVSNRNYENYPMAPAPWTVRPRPAVISGSTGGDDFNTLSNRLLDRCPAIGIQLAEQMINDSWHALQARKDWSWRRKSGTFAPPTLYAFGFASTNAASGNPYLITGVGTNWTASMIGSQIRVGGLLYPYYTITGWLSSTSLLIDQPWSGPDVGGAAYQILQVYYPVPADFGYFEVAVSIKDGYRLYTNATEYELALLDPQRTNQGQTYAAAFYDFTNNLTGGIIGPVNPVTSPTDPAPFSVTTTGYTYPASAVYIIQVVTGGLVGTATFQWMRAGQLVFSLPIVTSATPQDLADGVQIYWPEGPGPTWEEVNIPWNQDNVPWDSGYVYVAGDVFTINAEAVLTNGVARYELWPAPSYNGYLYPYIYFTKETDLTAQNPILPPPVANRGEVILEMALEKCATFPGADMDHPNPYFSLALASYHRQRCEQMFIDLENNDENIGVSRLTYEDWPFSGPWADGAWQQRHSPYL